LAIEIFFLASKLQEIVKRMPYSALPVVGKSSSQILEFPYPYPRAQCDIGTGAIPTPPDPDIITDTIDPSHRHFSHLHWLYPGTLLPARGGKFYKYL